MIDYSLHRIARIEHEEMIRSLPPIPEYGGLPPKADQPGWVARQAGRLLSALGNGLSSLGERLKPGQDETLEPSLIGQEQSGVSS